MKGLGLQWSSPQYSRVTRKVKDNVGVVYFVTQKVMKHLTQHFEVGLQNSIVVMQSPLKRSNVGSNPTFDKKAKSVSV